MDFALLIPVLIVLIVVGIPVVCATLIKLAKIIKGEPYSKSTAAKGLSASDEARLLQDLNASLSRLEQRIDSLETLVLQKPNPKR